MLRPLSEELVAAKLLFVRQSLMSSKFEQAQIIVDLRTPNNILQN